LRGASWLSALGNSTKEIQAETTVAYRRRSNRLKTKGLRVRKPEVETHEHERRRAENSVLRKQYETLQSTDSLVKRWIAVAAEFLQITPTKPKPE
jgi:hypothetical protein